MDGEKYAADEVMTMMAETEGTIIEVSPAFKKLFHADYDGGKILRILAEVGWKWKHMSITEPGEAVTELSIPLEGSCASFFNEAELKKRYRVKMVPFKTTQGLIDVLLFTLAPLREDNNDLIFLSNSTQVKDFALETEHENDVQNEVRSSLNPPSVSDTYSLSLSLMEVTLQEQRTPQSLQRLRNVVFLVFATMAIVGTTNLVLNSNTARTLTVDIDDAYSTYAYVANQAFSVSLVRDVLNVANGLAGQYDQFGRNTSSVFR